MTTGVLRSAFAVLRGASVVLGASLSIAACSLLGTPASEPGPAPHAGTGQFRLLSSDETNVAGVPSGAAIVTAGAGIDNGMVASGHFFYASAPAIPVDAGMRDSGVDAGDAGDPLDAGDPIDAGDPPDAGDPLDAGVDAARPDASIVDSGVPPMRDAVNWDRFEPRRISHSAPREEWGFTPGTIVLEAEEPWEGGYVTDPWVVARADGTFLLFYAAAGGIGLARATSIEGPYTRASGPLLAAVGSDVPRRPSAVLTAGLEGAPSSELLVYYELAGEIHVAGFDGSALTELATLAPTPLPQRDDRDGDEMEVGAPGALVVPTPSGRRVVRVYYESRRTNGTVLVGYMASADGLSFEFFERPVFAERDRQAPAPRSVDERVTLLYAWIPFRSTGAVINAITPGAVRLEGVAPTP